MFTHTYIVTDETIDEIVYKNVAADKAFSKRFKC